MKTIKLALLLLLSMAGAAGAQEPATLNGTWLGETTLPSGATAEVQMKVEGGGGTWTIAPLGRKDHANPCHGRAVPIAISEADGVIRVHIQAAQSLKGCQDGRVTMKRSDDRHLEGTFGDGRALKLQRR